MDSLTLSNAVAIDVCTIVVCAIVAWRCASSLLHPAVMIIGCHIYVVSLRLNQIFRGAHPMEYEFAWKVGQGEIIRAVVASDIALLSMTAAWVLVMLRARGRHQTNTTPRILLSPNRVRAFAIGTIALALIGSAIAGKTTQGAATDPSLSNSGYIGAFPGFWGWAGCILIYYYGFRPKLVALTAVLLAMALLTNDYRGVIVIPALFLIWTWVARRQGTGIPLALIPAVICVWLAWLPMKPIEKSLQMGEGIGQAIGNGVQMAFNNFGQEDGSAIDFQFLDMIGSTMTLVDVHDSYFYGSTFYALLVSPVPRAFWPGKPQLNEWQLALDIPSRPMAGYQMTAGLVGESYANFGWFGIILVPFGISFALASAYTRLQGTTLLSPGGLLYLIFISTFMQLYRDGVFSAVWFPFVHCAPVGWLAVSHWLWHPKHQPSEEELPVGEIGQFLPA